MDDFSFAKHEAFLGHQKVDLKIIHRIKEPFHFLKAWDTIMEIRRKKNLAKIYSLILKNEIEIIIKMDGY